MKRFVDAGAIFAGWVGVGVAIVIAIGLELILAVQSLVFIAAPLSGLLVGWYANARSARRRPWSRVLANSAYAGLVTGLAIALIYGALRLLFIYADSGYRDPLLGGQLECTPGPACTYARYVDGGDEAQLEALRGAGVVDARTFEAYVLREQASGGLLLLGLTFVGSIGGGAITAASGREARVPAPSERAA